MYLKQIIRMPGVNIVIWTSGNNVDFYQLVLNLVELIELIHDLNNQIVSNTMCWWPSDPSTRLNIWEGSSGVL